MLSFMQHLAVEILAQEVDCLKVEKSAAERQLNDLLSIKKEKLEDIQ